MAIAVLINPKTFEPRVAFANTLGEFWLSPIGSQQIIGSGDLELENVTVEEDASGYPRIHTSPVANQYSGDGTVLYTAGCVYGTLIHMGAFPTVRYVAKAGVSSSAADRSVSADAWWKAAVKRFEIATSAFYAASARYYGRRLSVQVYPFERAIEHHLVACVFGGEEVTRVSVTFDPNDVVFADPEAIRAMDLTDFAENRYGYYAWSRFYEIAQQSGLSKTDLASMRQRFEASVRASKAGAIQYEQDPVDVHLKRARRRYKRFET